jgi:hypothetical protein
MPLFCIYPRTSSNTLAIHLPPFAMARSKTTRRTFTSRRSRPPVNARRMVASNACITVASATPRYARRTNIISTSRRESESGSSDSDDKSKYLTSGSDSDDKSSTLISGSASDADGSGTHSLEETRRELEKTLQESEEARRDRPIISHTSVSKSSRCRSSPSRSPSSRPQKLPRHASASSVIS